MPNYSWPAPDKRRVMGKRLSRLDGPAKASGRAKYPSDVNRPGMLHAIILTSPHAHARVTSIDTSAAEKMPGVAGVRAISPAVTEIQWAGTEIAAVAAATEPQARDAARAIKVQYEVLEHVVREENLAAVGNRAKPAGEKITGDPDKAFKEADVVIEGQYGIPVITHCCLEPHGQVIEWKGDKIEYWPSTQAVSNIGGDLAKQLRLALAVRLELLVDLGVLYCHPAQDDARLCQSADNVCAMFETPHVGMPQCRDDLGTDPHDETCVHLVAGWAM